MYLTKHSIINSNIECLSSYKDEHFYRTYNKYITPPKRSMIFKCIKCNIQICGFFIKNAFRFNKKNLITCDEYIIKQIIE